MKRREFANGIYSLEIERNIKAISKPVFLIFNSFIIFNNNNNSFKKQ